MIDNLSAFPCLRGVVGKWVYYSTVMTAEQIARRINTAKSIREADGLNDYLQRELGKNVNKISKYLINNEWRMFNSIVVGVFDGIPDWITFNLDSIDRIDASPEELDYLSDSMGVLVLNGDEKMFAIDGQHRVEAIKKALKENSQSLIDDQYPVLLVAHIDNNEGKKRTRRLFYDINKKAVKVSGGDLAVISEEDIDAVVARKLYAEYRHFNNGKIIALTSTANMDKSDVTNFTNLLTLCAVAKLIKPSNIKSTNWNDVDVNSLYKTVTDFLDFMINNVNEYRSCFIETSQQISYYRSENPNMLFRPIGLILLSKLYIYFKNIDDLDYLQQNINKIDFNLPGRHYNLIVWNRGRIEATNQDVAYLLTLYLLDRLPPDMLDGDSGLIAKFGLATKGAIALPEKIV